MLSSLGKKGLASLFKEVRVFKVPRNRKLLAKRPFLQAKRAAVETPFNPVSSYLLNLGGAISPPKFWGWSV